MYARDDTTPTDRIDPDHYEPSPSTGGEQTARINHARGGYDHEPPSNDDTDPSTIRVMPPADTDGRTDTETDPAPRSREAFA